MDERSTRIDERSAKDPHSVPLGRELYLKAAFLLSKLDKLVPGGHPEVGSVVMELMRAADESPREGGRDPDSTERATGGPVVLPRAAYVVASAFPSGGEEMRLRVLCSRITAKDIAKNGGAVRAQLRILEAQGVVERGGWGLYRRLDGVAIRQRAPPADEAP